MLRSVALFVVVLSATIVPAAEHTRDPLPTVREKVRKQEAVLIDVRELAEWKAGHLSRAKRLSLSQLRTEDGLAAALKTLPKDTPVYIHCRSGARCLVAGKLFDAHGIDARPLKAGYKDLLEAGFEKAKPKE